MHPELHGIEVLERVLAGAGVARQSGEVDLFEHGDAKVLD